MPYRDDLEAATARHDALTRELADVHAKLVDHQPLQARAQELADELDEVKRRVTRARAKVSLPILTVSTPCQEPWDGMRGDDRVRFCGRCEKHVYNLSAMDAVDVDALLRARGAELCARFYRRPDGTVLTADCPVGARRRKRRLVVTAIAIAAGAIGVTWAAIERSDPAPRAQHEMMMGDVRSAPPPVIQGGISASTPPVDIVPDDGSGPRPMMGKLEVRHIDPPPPAPPATHGKHHTHASK